MLCLAIGLSSCFKDEPLNAECDIEQVTIHVANPAETFFQLTDTLKNVLYTDSVINFNVRSHADLTALAPRFVVTEGRMIRGVSRQRKTDEKYQKCLQDR